MYMWHLFTSINSLKLIHFNTFINPWTLIACFLFITLCTFKIYPTYLCSLTCWEKSTCPILCCALPMLLLCWDGSIQSKWPFGTVQDQTRMWKPETNWKHLWSGSNFHKSTQMVTSAPPIKCSAASVGRVLEQTDSPKQSKGVSKRGGRRHSWATDQRKDTTLEATYYDFILEIFTTFLIMLWLVIREKN